MIIDVMMLEQVEFATGLSRFDIYNYIVQEKFPKPISLKGRFLGWDKNEIEPWALEK